MTEPWQQPEPECFADCPRTKCPHFFECHAHFGPPETDTYQQADDAGLAG